MENRSKEDIIKDAKNHIKQMEAGLQQTWSLPLLKELLLLIKEQDKVIENQEAALSHWTDKAQVLSGMIDNSEGINF
jgi:hypothetical protein